MKVSSLTKEETINLLNLYKELDKVEKELKNYINNTAVPEVNNIKNAISKKEQSNEEATEILNSDFKVKDTQKMISLLEDYIESSNEINDSNAKAEEIMYVISELNDKIKDIDDEINNIENKELKEIKYDAIDIISDLKCKLINCDREFKNNIVKCFKSKYNYLLVPNKNNMTDELIKIVEEYINEKNKEEEESFKIIDNNVDKKVEEQPKQEEALPENTQPETNPTDNVIPLQANENIVNDINTIVPMDNEVSKEDNVVVPISNNENAMIDINTPINNEPVAENIASSLPIDTEIKVENNEVHPANETITNENGYTPISDILVPDNGPLSTPINNRIYYVDTNNPNSKIVKIPENKKETVSNNWAKRSFVKPIIKSIKYANTKEEISSSDVTNNFNLENFVNNKAA